MRVVCGGMGVRNSGRGVVCGRTVWVESVIGGVGVEGR